MIIIALNPRIQTHHWVSIPMKSFYSPCLIFKPFASHTVIPLSNRLPQVDHPPLLFSLMQAISSARRLHVSLLFCLCSIGRLIQSVLAKYDKIILKDEQKNIQEQVLSKRSKMKRTPEHD